MSYRVIVTARARADLRETVAWWGEHRSTVQAGRWYDKILPTLASLGLRPERYPLAYEADLLPTGLRQLHFGLGRRPTHRIIFTVDGSDVVVFRIRHIARDWLTSEDL